MFEMQLLYYYRHDAHMTSIISEINGPNRFPLCFWYSKKQIIKDQSSGPRAGECPVRKCP